MNEVNDFLGRARTRIAGARALTWTVRGAAVGALAAALCEVAFRQWPVDPTWPVLAGCGLAGALVALAGWLRAWPSWMEVARIADLELGGKERLTTALEYVRIDGYLPQRQRFDAQAFAASADPSRLSGDGVPARLLAVAAGALVVAVGLALLPNPALDRLRVHNAGTAVQAKAADEIARLATQESQAARAGEDPAQRQALVKDLQKASDQVRKASDPSSAVAAISQAQSDIRSLSDPTVAQRQQGSAQAGQALAQLSGPAQKAGQSMANQDNRGAAAALQQLGQQLGSMSAAQQQSLAQQLQSAAQAAQQGGNQQLAQQLQAAASALQSGDAQAAQAALNQAAAAQSQLAGAQDFQGDSAQSVNTLQGLKGPLDDQAEAQAAQPGQGQPGQGQGQSQGKLPTRGQGEGQGAGQGAGQGQGQTQGQGNGAGQGGQGGQGAQGGGGGQGSNAGQAAKSNEKVYIHGRSELSGNGQNAGTGPGQDAQLVPFQSVLADYQQQALSQVDREVIPDQERDLVQQYFSDLSK